MKVTVAAEEATEAPLFNEMRCGEQILRSRPGRQLPSRLKGDAGAVWLQAGRR